MRDEVSTIGCGAEPPSRLPFSLPPPPGRTGRPFWDGTVFRLDGEYERVLCYGADASGWTEALTTLHEDTVGGTHFIDVASRRHCLAQLKKYVRGPYPVIIEIGCSGGHLLNELQECMPDAMVIGTDVTIGPLVALSHRSPSTPLLQFDLVNCPLPNGCADAVVLLNVLEHIEKDEAAIRNVFRILKPGGIMIIEAPAGRAIFDSYDRHLMHFRRYSMGDLLKSAAISGFDVLYRSHLGFFIYPAFWLTKKISQLRDGPNRSASVRRVRNQIRQSGRFSWIMNLVMWIEQVMRKYIYLPVGVRCLMTCQKP